MNKQKQVPNVKLQKTSVIFMQLGLILALFIVYIVLEHESNYKVKKLASSEVINTDNEPYIPVDFTIEPKKKKVIKRSQVKKIKKVITKQIVSSTFKTVKNTELILDDVLPPTTDDDQENPIITDDFIPDGVDDIEVIDEPLPFIKIEIAPTFPGCKGSEIEKRACFNKKMNKHINQKFNVDIAQNIGLNSGKKRINVQFIIDEKGDIINVQVASPYIQLKKEATRVINLLPKMIPAKQRLNNVKVRYNLPIIFNVED